VVMAYGGVPLTTYVMRGMTFVPGNDWRLYRDQPGPEIMGELGWMHLLYVLAFIIGYAQVLRRSNERQLPAAFDRPSGALIGSCVALLAIVWAFGFAVERAYGISQVEYGNEPQFARLPLFMRQVYINAQLTMLPLKVVILAALFSDYKRFRYWIVVFIVVVAGPVLWRVGERGGLVVVLLCAVALYHRRVRPLTAAQFGVIGVILFAGFTAFGAWRARQGPSFGIMGTNEFEACFSTSREVLQASRAGVLANTPPQLYIADFLALIPQQLLPFPKTDGNLWYLHQFIPDIVELYQGYGFGVIAESSIGLGYFELIAKGLIIGLIFGRLTEWYRRSMGTWWITAIYAFICASCFRTFRSSTFELIRTLTFSFLPSVLAVTALTRVVVSFQDKRGPGQAGPPGRTWRSAEARSL
jgi:hypothetical protein